MICTKHVEYNGNTWLTNGNRNIENISKENNCQTNEKSQEQNNHYSMVQ